MSAPDRTTCPRRMAEMGPWEYQPFLDSWQLRGADRCCSFCGSAHPEEFLAFLRQAVEVNAAVDIEPTDKGYKYYIHREGVTGGEGAIKFYTMHLPTDGREAAFALLRPAVVASDVRSQARFATRLAQLGTQKT